MDPKYTLEIHDGGAPILTETFEARPEQVTTESTGNGERIIVSDDFDDILLEMFVPKGTAYTLRKED